MPDGSCWVNYCPEDYCYDAGGFPGENLCEPNTCPGAPGACCFPDEICIEMPGNDCDLAGGEFEGEGTVCDPNPCIPTPIESVTWGKIRAVYR